MSYTLFRCRPTVFLRGQTGDVGLPVKRFNKIVKKPDEKACSACAIAPYRRRVQ